MKVELRLTTVYLKPGFRKVEHPIPLTQRLRDTCEEIILVRGGSESRSSGGGSWLDNPCPSYLAWRPNSDVMRDAMNLPEDLHPNVEVMEYCFGATSIRVSMTVESSDPRELSRMWTLVAHEIREYVKSHLSSMKVDRMSHSRFFSEVFFPHPVEVDDETVRWLLSPLKRTASKPDFTIHEVYDRHYISKDGTMVMFSPRSGLSTRRRMRKRIRKIIAVSSDLSLSQTVFYSNTKMWDVSEGSWGPLMGLLVLNPRVVGRLLSRRDNAFGAIYRRISESLGVPGLFDNYISSLWAVGLDLKGAYTIFRHLHRIGVPRPELDDEILMLTPLEYRVLEALAAKQILDNRLEGRSDYVQVVSEVLCDYMLGDKKFNCSSTLMRRIKGRKDKQGLSAPELAILIKGGTDKSLENRIRRNVIRRMLTLNLIRSSSTPMVSRRGRGMERRVEIYEIMPLKRSVVALLELVETNLLHGFSSKITSSI